MQLGVILIVQSLKLQAESVVEFVMIVSIIQWGGTVSNVNPSFTKILVVISGIQISVKVILAEKYCRRIASYVMYNIYRSLYAVIAKV